MNCANPPLHRFASEHVSSWVGCNVRAFDFVTVSSGIMNTLELTIKYMLYTPVPVMLVDLK